MSSQTHKSITNITMEHTKTPANKINDEIGDFSSKKSEARIFAESNGKVLVDVSEYVDEKDKGKDTKTLNKKK